MCIKHLLLPIHWQCVYKASLATNTLAVRVFSISCNQHTGSMCIRHLLQPTHWQWCIQHLLQPTHWQYVYKASLATNTLAVCVYGISCNQHTGSACIQHLLQPTHWQYVYTASLATNTLAVRVYSISCNQHTGSACIQHLLQPTHWQCVYSASLCATLHFHLYRHYDIYVCVFLASEIFQLLERNI